MASREASYRSQNQAGGMPSYPAPVPQTYAPTSYAPQNYSSSTSRSRQPSNSARQASATGGLSVVLGETESWSDLAQKDNTLPADAKELINSKGGPEKPSGMLGFLSRKKGRGHSPKPMERGILSGKEGGRVVVGQG